MEEENKTDLKLKGKVEEKSKVSADIVKINSITTPLLAKATANIILGSIGLSANYFSIPFSKKKKKTLAQEKTELIKELSKLDVDPEKFDTLLTNELDRKLKVSFGMAFLALTCIFTATSYAIVILDALYNWDISEIAITALIIETPIQFIGLLYIIARNLFPNSKSNEKG